MYRRLKVRRRSLLRSYDDETLHQLRIVLRRIRGFLKLQPGGKAHRLRHDLGVLANATNAARDWDTFVIYARCRLTQGQFRQLQPRLEARQTVAHQRVTRMLRSKRWSTSIKRWKKYTRHTTLGSSSPTDTRQHLAQAIDRASSAKHRALSWGNDKSWHKLRIAIKELRYELENLAKDLRSPETVSTLAVCKRLQDDLGVWHDTVVHRQLLHELHDNREPDEDTQAVHATQTLRRLIEQEGRDCLDRIKSTVGSAQFY